VNVGVFYAQQHGSTEYLDVYSLDKLVQAVKIVEWENLPIKREPKEEVYRPPFQNGRTADMYSGMYGYEYEDVQAKQSKTQPKPAQTAKPQKPAAQVQALSCIVEMDNFSMDDFENLVYSESEIAVFAMAGLFARYKGLKAEVAVYRKLLDV
jgi:hypothetical protein